MTVSKIKLIFFTLAIVLTNSTCAQQKLREISDRSEVQVDLEFVGKAGVTKVYSMDLKTIPNGPTLPNGYQLIAGKAYDVKTDEVEYGEPIITFKLAITTEDEFKRVRIFHLVSTELNPDGYEWQDCTIAGKEWLFERTDQPSDSWKDRIFKFLPDFEKKQISCAPDRLEGDNYFALSLEIQPSKSEQAVAVKLDQVEETAGKPGKKYVVSFTNNGNKPLSQINFYSHFDPDTKLEAFVPSQGKCQKAKFGSSYGSIVCYMGQVSPSASVRLVLHAVPSNNGLSDAPVLNRGWVIYGVAKEDSNDATSKLNSFSFQPFSNK